MSMMNPTIAIPWFINRAFGEDYHVRIIFLNNNTLMGFFNRLLNYKCRDTNEELLSILS